MHSSQESHTTPSKSNRYNPVSFDMVDDVVDWREVPVAVGNGEEDMLVLTRGVGESSDWRDAADDAASDVLQPPDTVAKERAAEQRDAALVSRSSILRVATGLGMGGAEEREK